MALAAVLALTTLFTGCKAPSSGGGGNSFNALETPLTLEAIADGQITFNNPYRATNLKYRINDGEVKAATNTGISLSAGDKISLFAEGTLNGELLDHSFTINCSSDCYVYGNVMSLLTADYQTATEITQNYYAFAGLFFNNSHIKNHPSKNIVLPATALAYGCYASMFRGCTSLTQAPVLPATTLVTGCYALMFSGCTSLTQAPALPATTLADVCYRSMFSGCTSLNKVTCLATDLSATGCTGDWLSGVASSGTFTKASGADWSVKTGYDGIPSGWTTQNK